MCGIVGLFLKTDRLRPQLGDLMTDMLITMTDRGPDSAGLAIYSDSAAYKLTVQSDAPDLVFPQLDDWLAKYAKGASLRALSTHAVISTPVELAESLPQDMQAAFPDLRIMSGGASMEVYKEVGLPRDVATRFGLREMAGTHGIGHTRMATESAVTTDGFIRFQRVTINALSIMARCPITTRCAANWRGKMSPSPARTIAKLPPPI